MAHAAQLQFVQRVKALHNPYFADKKVLEVGSLNVNGSIRPYFRRCEYTGIDYVDGPGVDIPVPIKQYVHTYRPDNPPGFDVVACCEVLEHDPMAFESLELMFRVLRPGGLFIMTCANEARPEHGTTRTGSVWGPNADFYRGVSLYLFSSWMVHIQNEGPKLDVLHIEENHEAQDLYAYAIKAQS